MTKLYELTEQLKGLQDLSEEIPEEALADTLEALEGAFEEKAVNICHVLANGDADIAAIKAEVDRLNGKLKAINASKERLKDYLRHNMEATGINKISHPLFTISLRKPQPIVLVVNEEAVPEEYQRVTVAVDKTKAKAALKDGVEIPGLELATGKAGVTIK